MNQEQETTTGINQLRFAPNDVIKLIGLVGALMVQFFLLRSEFREAKLEQHRRDDLQDVRIQSNEDDVLNLTSRFNAFATQPAIKPDAITIQQEK